MGIGERLNLAGFFFFFFGHNVKILMVRVKQKSVKNLGFIEGRMFLRVKYVWLHQTLQDSRITGLRVGKKVLVPRQYYCLVRRIGLSGLEGKLKSQFFQLLIT